MECSMQVFEHSGDLAFLGQAYDFYKELFKESIPGHLISYDAVRCLRKMAGAPIFFLQTCRRMPTANAEGLDRIGGHSVGEFPGETLGLFFF